MKKITLNRAGIDKILTPLEDNSFLLVHPPSLLVETLESPVVNSVMLTIIVCQPVNKSKLIKQLNKTKKQTKPVVLQFSWRPPVQRLAQHLELDDLSFCFV